MTNDLSPEKVKSIHAAIFAGNKIEAIKLYRLATGLDLKDSKKKRSKF